MIIKNTTLPTAQQAREMNNNRLINQAETQLNYITNLILLAINDDKKYITGEGSIIRCNIDKLKELGYIIHIGSQYGQIYYCISW